MFFVTFCFQRETLIFYKPTVPFIYFLASKLYENMALVKGQPQNQDLYVNQQGEQEFNIDYQVYVEFQGIMTYPSQSNKSESLAHMILYLLSIQQLSYYLSLWTSSSVRGSDLNSGFQIGDDQLQGCYVPFRQHCIVKARLALGEVSGVQDLMVVFVNRQYTNLCSLQTVPQQSKGHRH